MKKVMIIMLLSVAMLMVSCGPGNRTNNQKIQKDTDRIKTICTYYGYSTYEIIEADGHLYLSTYSGGIIHMESCTCKSKQ